MGGEDRIETKALRRLRAPKFIAGERAGHAAGARIVKVSVTGRQGRAASCASRLAMTRVISAGSTKGRAASWISTRSGGLAASASSPERTESWRSCATRNRRPQPRRESLRGGLVQPGILWMDHHDHVVHARMAGKGGDGPGHHRHAADRQYCFGISCLRASGSDPAAGRHDQGGNAHGEVPISSLDSFVHCGKSLVATASKSFIFCTIKDHGARLLILCARRRVAGVERIHRLSASTRKTSVAASGSSVADSEPRRCLSALPHPLLVIGEGLHHRIRQHRRRRFLPDERRRSLPAHAHRRRRLRQSAHRARRAGAAERHHGQRIWRRSRLVTASMRRSSSISTAARCPRRRDAC